MLNHFLKAFIMLNIVIWASAQDDTLFLSRAEKFEDNDFGDYVNTLDESKLEAIPGQFPIKADGPAEFMMLNSNNYMVFTSSSASATFFKHYVYNGAHYYQIANGPTAGYWLSWSSNGYLGAYSWINTRAFSSTGCLSASGQSWKTYKYPSGGVNYVVIGTYSYSVVCFQNVEYDTISIGSKYVGESTSCGWQAAFGQCPPFVTYYTAAQAQTIALTVDGGMLKQAGKLFDTSQADLAHTGPKAIIVMDIYGNLFASNQFKPFMFHHSTILAGADVTFAGEIVVKAGVIQSVTTCSGHYLPPISAGTSFTTSLKRLAYTATVVVSPCVTPIMNNSFIWDLDYNCVHESCKDARYVLRDLDYDGMSSERNSTVTRGDELDI